MLLNGLPHGQRQQQYTSGVGQLISHDCFPDVMLCFVMACQQPWHHCITNLVLAWDMLCRVCL